MFGEKWGKRPKLTKWTYSVRIVEEQPDSMDYDLRCEEMFDYEGKNGFELISHELVKNKSGDFKTMFFLKRPSEFILP